MTLNTKLYNLLITPRQADEDARNRELVLNVLLAGTMTVAVAGLLLLIVEVIIMHDMYLAARAAVVLGIAAFVGLVYLLSRLGWHNTASLFLVGIYFLIATLLAAQWGINIPVGVLLYGLVIVLAGILLGPKYSLFAATAVIVTLTILVKITDQGLIHPDWSWVTKRPSMIDVAGFSLIYSILALVSWLFNKQMTRSLDKAEKAESALLKQKALLETAVEERTRELQTAQLEKIQQMYRFAELGQLSTALMHELANHLTSLTLDIEGLEGQGRSRAVNRAKRSIRYIDDMVVRVREQLHGKSHTRSFNVVSEVDAVVTMLRHKAQIARVQLKWQAPPDAKDLLIKGEPVRLRQLMANLISNGIDAYYEPRDEMHERRDVEVRVESDELYIIISVNDWGRGIPEQHADKLFEPFFSTKQTGMGMGLYISKQVVIEHFLGDINVVSPAHPTSFVITLPKA